MELWVILSSSYHGKESLHRVGGQVVDRIAVWLSGCGFVSSKLIFCLKNQSMQGALLDTETLLMKKPIKDTTALGDLCKYNNLTRKCN